MLSVIGFILLWLLRIIGMVLLFLLIVISCFLFVPFKYKAEGDFQESITVLVKFSWLFSIVNGQYRYLSDGTSYRLRILWFTLSPKKEKPVKKKSVKKINSKVTSASKESSSVKTAKKELNISENIDDSIDINVKEVKASTPTEVSNITKEPKVTAGSTKNTGEGKEDETEKKVIGENKVEAAKEDKKVSKAPKTKKVKAAKGDKGQSIEQIKELWEFLQLEENEGVLKFITKYVYKLIRWILPRGLNVELELGLEDPALTGYIAGIASIAYVLTKRNIHIVPNFEETMIKGSFKIRGRLFIFQLLYYIIRVILDKRVRRLIKKVRT